MWDIRLKAMNKQYKQANNYKIIDTDSLVVTRGQGGWEGGRRAIGDFCIDPFLHWGLQK